MTNAQTASECQHESVEIAPGRQRRDDPLGMKPAWACKQCHVRLVLESETNSLRRELDAVYADLRDSEERIKRFEETSGCKGHDALAVLRRFADRLDADSNVAKSVMLTILAQTLRESLRGS